MGRGLLDIVIGAVFIVGGLTGKLALIGTKSGVALAVLGFGLVGLGIWRIGSAKKAPAGPTLEERRAARLARKQGADSAEPPAPPAA